MKKLKKVIGFVTIMMLLSLQISADVFAVTSEDISVQEISKIEAPQTEETTSPTEESKAADDEAKPTDTTESVEGTQPPTSETGDDLKEEDSSKPTEPDEDLMQNKEIDLEKGSVVINEKTIRQGSNSWEILHQGKPIILTGTGSEATSVTIENYTGVILLKGATIPNSMKLTNGSVVSLVLEGGNTINATDKNTALQVAAGNTVIITGDVDGSLTAIGVGGGAGIGGIPNEGAKGSYKHDEHTAGTIIISSGTVNAQGNGGGAGIGGANHNDGGNITIGGTAVVEARSNGDNGGAGIGSGTGSHVIDSEGQKGPGYFHGGEITIKGNCDVTAYGAGNAAGIGGGYCADSGNIQISGGTVNAYGGGQTSLHHGGAGIGGGYEGHGKVDISGGTIIAEASGAINGAAGIGSGGSPNFNSKRTYRGTDVFSTITQVSISGAQISAKGGASGGAGIGGGAAADKVEVSIAGGTINAKGAVSDKSTKLGGGAGIGGGASFKSIKDEAKYWSATDLTVEVTGGNITSTGGWGASGIGSGADNIRAKKVDIDTAANITAFADGTKFAVDTLERAKTPENQEADVTTWSGSNVLQGTFVADESYEGKTVNVYEDDSSAVEPDKIAYGSLVKTENLPSGYRSFATTVKSNSNYLLKSGVDWFGYDTKAKSEASGLEDQGFTPHYKTGSDIISDNYWLYPGKNEATESDLGQVNVTKKVTENGLSKVVNQTFYLGIFTDEGLKTLAKLKDGENAIVPIVLSGTSEATVQKKLPAGEYFTAEVNADGTVVNNTDTHKVTVKVNGEVSSKLTVAKAEQSNVEITNAYTQVNVEQPYQDGSFKATKNVTLNDQPNQVTETYNVGIFDDAFFTKPTTNTDGQKIIVPISLQNASTASVDNINIPIGTFYATEVDSSGTPIVSTSDLNVSVAVDGTQTNRFTITGYNKPHIEITNAYTEVVNPYKEGQFSVTKHVTLNGEDFGMKDTFYLGVFNNSDFTDVTINADDEKLIVPIDLNGNVEATIENIDIPIGTFYVTEVTKNGKPVESNEGLKVTVTVDGTETSQLVIAEDGAAPHVTITNAYIDDTPQYYWTGTINVTKKVLENGKAHKMDQAKYYAGVFTDKNYSSLLTDDNDQPVIMPLNLKDSSKVSASVDVPVGAEGAATTYYVAEVTKDGELITKNSGMKFTPVIKGGTATVSGTKEANVTIENHYGKKAPSTDNTSDKSPDKQSKANAVQTGDESRTMPFILLALAAALIAVAVIRRKRI